jgi:trigger factor
VKTDVEELGPTRVKLTIEVPFEELKPSLDQAYREVARQVRVPGFRPGHVPPRVIDQRFGRGVVLEQAVNEAVPKLYGQALADNEVYALGQPELEITQLDDGQQLAFTAEVDIRPKFDLPDLDGMPVTVDNAEVTPDEVEEYIGRLRDRFASLRGVDRPVEQGDFVSIDLSASVDGAPVEDAQASGLSYEVGSGSMLEGLDEALTGMASGDSATFTAELAGGELAGQQADVTVTVHSVKVKDLPELDDEFAQSASEFDTIGEFRASTRERLVNVKRMQQVGQARERAMDAVLDRIDVPLPERLVAQEIEAREESLTEQIERAGSSRDSYLEARGLSSDELDAELAKDARRAVKAGFVLDQLALTEELGIEQEELNSYVIEQAYRMGVPPDRLAKELTDRGQLNVAVAEVLRSKALGLIAERVSVTDEAGQPVDVKALAEAAEQGQDPGGQAAAAGEAAAADDGNGAGQDEAAKGEAGDAGAAGEAPEEAAGDGAEAGAAAEAAGDKPA